VGDHPVLRKAHRKWGAVRTRRRGVSVGPGFSGVASEVMPVQDSGTFSSTHSFDLNVRHRVVLFGIAAAILIAGIAIALALPALAGVFPHDPSTCGGG
jgi:hypothetical protein